MAYERRISGPILDRIDICLQVNKVDYKKLAARTVAAETSADMRERVIAARSRQVQRYIRHGISKCYNSEMSAQDIETCVNMEDSARFLLARSAEKLDLSGRGFHRVIKVAQTIADLAGKEIVQPEHVLEALQYRTRGIGASARA
jgi:magnesium chelatase family protein